MSGSDDPRIEELLTLLERLASGDLNARGTPSPAGDGLDAVMTGVNALAVALESSRRGADDWTDVPAADIGQTPSDVLRLIHFGSRLESCVSLEEAHRAISEGLPNIFDASHGAFYRLQPAGGPWELETSWGDLIDVNEDLTAEECWGLRLRVPHVARTSAPALSCAHVAERAGDSICVPLFVHGETFGLLHVMGRGPTTGLAGGLSRATRHLAAAVGDQIMLSLSSLELRTKLAAEALRDPLTGLHNRRFVDDWIQREVGRSDRSSRPFGLIMIDVDHFKQVNDNRGHADGDEVLKAIADTFRTSLRLGDVPCRYGGEEFLILLPNIGIDALSARAETLRRRVADLRLEHGGAPLPRVTVSAGVAVYPTHGSSAGEVVQAADTAMYEAKLAGRNQVRSAARGPDA